MCICCTIIVDNESESEKSAAIEVTNIPADCTAERLTAMFENKRYTGVDDAEVVSVQFIDESHSQGIITFSDPSGEIACETF